MRYMFAPSAQLKVIRLNPAVLSDLVVGDAMSRIPPSPPLFLPLSLSLLSLPFSRSLFPLLSLIPHSFDPRSNPLPAVTNPCVKILTRD